MYYWRKVLEQRISGLEKYLCGVCERGWVLQCVVLATRTNLWVCEECDTVWRDVGETVLKASPVSPEFVLTQIVGPPAGTLRDYVKPYNGTDQPLTDWDQIKLSADAAHPGHDSLTSDPD
ncbi:hypothetical protein Pen02_82220 [Plantactinospora endophytica]|uniref:ClpX-type ZB domain-containing protein n=1 Tax=Plantactinospora endophytica TaxID=673535 RepID=A0ABQ4EGA0_9ACTN|nr:hypothetical protein Pen02_82220 [Plantactinospora endophytica]